MIHAQEIWEIIQTKMPKGRWVLLDEIYHLVEEYGGLDAEDFGPQSPTSDIPKWKRNVRNILQYRRSTGEILWNGAARYLLA